jgi:hypothetical protein
MKVPTYSKYGLKKTRVEKREERKRIITHTLTHSIPFVLGAAGGIIVYFIIHKGSYPETFTEFIGRLFIFATSGVLCIGILMLVFKLLDNLFTALELKRSEELKCIQKYKSDREEYEYRKIRTEESFWKLIDGLSVENELLNVFRQYGFLITPIKDAIDKGRNDYFLTNSQRNIYFRCNTSKVIDNTIHINEILKLLNNSAASEAILFSTLPYNKEQLKKTQGKSLQLMSVKDVTELVKNMK